MGLSGSITLIQDIGIALEASLGMAYDILGIKLENGKLGFEQHFKQGADLSLGIPIISGGEELYRNPFSSTNEHWQKNTDETLTIFSVGTYFIAGVSLSISFDLMNFIHDMEIIWQK